MTPPLSSVSGLAVLAGSAATGVLLGAPAPVRWAVLAPSRSRAPPSR
ncbi:hypothetical protein [Streptomyces brevispora]|uniref:Uncharacterized protein n=1 Tax=Streptomyces brevispora TaxID=887462 RepID=A0ABZ1G4N8_9ACTN|nr:hypothetical protein [Streptomyces brevispora]WSC14187.1 hypothetical protein OIE64_15935 [Streptomyces brevispora]